KTNAPAAGGFGTATRPTASPPPAGASPCQAGQYPVAAAAMPGRLARELVEQRLALLLAEAAQPTAVSDLELLHGLGRLDLADPRQGLQHRDHLELADHIIGLGTVKQLGEGDLAVLELFLEVGPSLANLGCLLQSGGSLLGAQ